MLQRIAPVAFDLIVRFETGGREFYEQVYKSAPCWPGGASGVTIGCGYDLAFEEHFAADWQKHLPLDSFTRLARCIGKSGARARQALSGVRDIRIPWDKAIEVFNERNLPREIRLTNTAFPFAYNKLPAPAYGALVSLVFNRGAAIDSSDRRREMAAIRTKLAGVQTVATAADLRFLAAQFRSMKRLWSDDPKSDGDLVDRREAEARLIESAG